MALDLNSPQGTLGWSGGYLATSVNSDSGNSSPASFSTTNMTWDGSSCWTGNQAWSTPIACKGSGHPGENAVSAAWKYVVPPGRAGNATITFTATMTDIGATSIAIWVNNTKVAGYSNVTYTPTTVTTTQYLTAGDTVIFELNARGSYGYDSTAVNQRTIKS